MIIANQIQFRYIVLEVHQQSNTKVCMPSQVKHTSLFPHINSASAVHSLKKYIMSLSIRHKRCFHGRWWLILIIPCARATHPPHLHHPSEAQTPTYTQTNNHRHPHSSLLSLSSLDSRKNSGWTSALTSPKSASRSIVSNKEIMLKIYTSVILICKTSLMRNGT